jgi:hypothetical protein
MFDFRMGTLEDQRALFLLARRFQRIATRYDRRDLHFYAAVDLVGA